MGIVAPIVTFVSYQVNTKHRLLFLQTGATVTNCISYLLLGGDSGFALNIVCVVRNLIYFFLDSQSKANRIIAVILALAMGGMGLLSWEGPVSLLLIVALAANTIFMSFGDPQLLRKSVIGTSSLILIYNLLMAHPTIGGIANECIAIVASIIGVIIYRKKNERTDMVAIGEKWYVLFFYVLNIIMVFIDFCLYFRNRKLDKKASA